MTRPIRHAATFVALVLLAGSHATRAADPPKPIAVFDFELMDSSAGGGVIPPDDNDKKYLAESAATAKKMLAATGAYTLVDPTPAAADLAAAGELRRCQGCEAGIAKKLGADFAMTGVINRISRTEYEMQIRIIDAATGNQVATGYTGLRMGANYSWPRGVKWLMEKRVLPGGQ